MILHSIKNTRLGLLASILFLVSSCNPFNNCEKVNVDKNELEWINGISNRDTLVFKSNFGKIKQYIVENITSDYSSCNKIELSPYIYESLGLKMFPLSEPKSEDSTFSILLYEHYDSEEYKWAYKGINVFSYHVSIKDESNNALITDTIAINNSKIKTYYFERGVYEPIKSDMGSNMKSFHWSKKLGLVQFETAKNEIFKLVID